MTAKDCGAFIADLRKEKNLTQKQLAEILKVSDKAISRWETGKGFPDVTSLVALSEFFGISVNELLAGKKAKNEIFTKIADNNVIVAIENTQKQVKKRKTQTIICSILFSLALLPSVIPAFIYFADEIILVLKKYLSFDNLNEFIIAVTVSVFLVASGFAVSRGHISLLHSYHYKNVVDRDGYCKAMGKTMMIMGITTFVSSFSSLFPTIHFPTIHFIEVLGGFVLFSGLLVGCVFLFKHQYKYNGGLF